MSKSREMQGVERQELTQVLPILTNFYLNKPANIHAWSKLAFHCLLSRSLLLNGHKIGNLKRRRLQPSQFIHSSASLRYFEEDHHDHAGEDGSAPYNRPMGLVVEDSENEYILKKRYDLAANNIHCNKTLDFKPKRVLVLSKTTRYEILSRRADNKAATEGVLRQKHEQQLKYIDEICDQLSKHGIDTNVVKASDYTVDAIKNAQLVISAGGDGTFLTAASMIRDSTPCIGINTDPVGSEGHLCLTGKEACNVRDVLDRFLEGRFRFFPRHRLRVTLLTDGTPNDVSRVRNDSIHDEHHSSQEVKFCSEDEEAIYTRPEIPTPLLALNEVFVGESHAARVSYLEVQLDDGEVYKQKNSGIIVCSGTGSTSWHYNINRLTEQNFSDVLQKMHDMGYRVEPPLNTNGINDLCQRYNEELIFAPDEKKMVYSIRDPVFNCTYPKIPPRGTIRQIRIKSKCSHAHLTLDGATSIPFNHGAEALIELHEEDALQTAILT